MGTEAGQSGYNASDTASYVQPGTHVNLKYPKFDFAYARRVAEGISEEVGIGGSLTVHSAPFDIESSKQDYDLQTILSSSAESSGLNY